MSQEIESGKFFIKQLFEKWFRVPEYQRPYVWGSDQVNELLEDIYQAYVTNPESQYFLGSLVLKKTDKNDGTNKYEEYDLLDGQQRLITLLLVHAVVRDLAPIDSQLKTLCQKSIYQEENKFDNIPDRNRIVFDIRDQVREFIDKYVKSDGGTKERDTLLENISKEEEDISIKNISNALLTIHGFFAHRIDLNKFFSYFRSNVLMIYVAADLLEDAFHLFTVMNNRGIKLRNSDILKAENLAKIEKEDERKKYAKKWESIEEYFGEEFDNFLSQLRTILVKQRTSQNLLKEYEENIYAPKEYDRNTKISTPKKPLLDKGKPTIELIDTYYKHYTKLFDEDNYNVTSSFELFNQLKLMSLGFEADYWKAPLLRYYERFQTDQIMKFVYLLDKKFSADWISSLTSTSRIDNINAIIKEIETSKDCSALFESSVFNIQKEDLVRVLTGNIYGRKYAKYLLLKIDLSFLGHATKFNPPPTISIEHILPQSPDIRSLWVNDFNVEDRTTWTDRLGNLILISRIKNSSQGNLDYARKKERYFKKNIELFSNSIRIMHYFPTWTLEDLKKNQAAMLTKVFKSYDITPDEAGINEEDLVKERLQTVDPDVIKIYQNPPSKQPTKPHITIEEKLEGKDKEIVSIFNFLREKIKAFQPSVTEGINKSYIYFKTTTNFFEVYVHQDFVTFYFIN